MDEKYVVFPYAEFWSHVDSYDWDGFQKMKIKDAVVIRTQDVFAAAGLSAYAQNIIAYITTRDIDLAALTPLIANTRHSNKLLAEWIDAERLKVAKLGEIANYFIEIAGEAEDRMGRGECKVPD